MIRQSNVPFGVKTVITREFRKELKRLDSLKSRSLGLGICYFILVVKDNEERISKVLVYRGRENIKER